MIEARTVDEAYSSACNTDDLTVKAERRSDADVLIAAGLSPGILGHALMRLHGEWDAAAKPARITQADATLLYGQLKSLQRVLGIISEYLTQKGEDKPLVGAKALVMYWLDDKCQPCGGRGSHPIPGTPTLGMMCRACGGGKKRTVPLGQAGRRTLNMMDDAVSQARRSIQKRLRNM